MAFFDKLGDLAKNIGDKTTDAIETGKLNSKIGSETAAAAAQLQKVGEFYYAKFAAGEQVSPEALEFCQAAAAHYAGHGRIPENSGDRYCRSYQQRRLSFRYQHFIYYLP